MRAHVSSMCPQAPPAHMHVAQVEAVIASVFGPQRGPSASGPSAASHQGKGQGQEEPAPWSEVPQHGQPLTPAPVASVVAAGGVAGSGEGAGATHAPGPGLAPMAAARPGPGWVHVSELRGLLTSVVQEVVRAELARAAAEAKLAGP